MDSALDRPGEDVRRRHVDVAPSSSSQPDVNDPNGRLHSGTPTPVGPFGPTLPPIRQESRTGATRASITYMIICGFYVIIALFVHLRLNSYPEPKLRANSKPFEFLEENAQIHLDLITQMGPRVSGSKENLEAERYIMDYLERLQEEALPQYKIDINLQRVSGSFTLDFVNVGIGEFTSVYQNLTNVVARLSPSSGARDSVLVNCHYDTVVDSPGAGDDASSCCLMLEVMRAISQNPHADLMHTIIFLFNSAEENILQTSHGFITQHPWAHSIRAFVNLDSAGAGGWELVFQTGPEHPWLIKTYIEAAPYPHASCIGQEIFQTGLIPSDTDYRIFRDYGHIPGLDIAYTKNGYVYHTRNDQAQYIPPGCMQRGGENVLATLLRLASSSKLSNPGEDRHGTMVFFDYLGFVMVAYPKRMALIINWATFLFFYLSFVKKLYRDREPANLLRMTLMGTISMVATWLIVLATAVLMAVALGVVGRQLSYFTHSLNVVWLFILPAITAAISFHLILKRTIFKNIEGERMASVLQESTLIMWSLVLAAMTAAGLMSSFLPLMCILAPTFTQAILQLLGVKPTSLFSSLLGSLIPSVYALYLLCTLMAFLVPIMGRRGVEGNPDILIAILACLPVFICLPYHISFVYTHKRVARVVTITLAVILLGLAAVIFTPCGFPYSSSGEVSRQRAMLLHVDRRFHRHQGQKVRAADSHVWYVPLDVHSLQPLTEQVPSLMARARQSSCDGVYCGRPYLYPMLNLVDATKTYDFPASPIKAERARVNLTDRLVISDTDIRLFFAMEGPSHVTIFVSERPNSRVLRWSFGELRPVRVFTPPWVKEPTFFIYYSHCGNTSWHFSMDVHVEGNKKLTSPHISIGFAGHHMHGPHQMSLDLESIENELPPWIIPVSWTATYDEFVF